MVFRRRSTFRKRPVRKFRSRKTRFGRKKRTSWKRTTTGRESVVMKDRSFIKFKYTTLTDATSPTTVLYTAANGSGMIPFGTTLSAGADMFVFYPTYAVTTGTPNLLGAVRTLPGNSLNLYSITGGTGIQYFSDKFTQQMPTGADAWTAFYNKFLVHGSSIQVTMAGPTVAGQMIVMPVIVNSYTGITSNNIGPNWNALTSFAALPDDQPYAKIKFISGSGGQDRSTISHRMLTKKLFDIKNLRDAQENTGTMNITTPVDPTQNLWSWFIAWIPTEAQALSSNKSVRVQVKITYFTELMDRKTLNYVGAF